MAKAKVAGQPGFDPFKSEAAPQPLETRSEEIGPAEIAPKQKREAPPIPTTPARESTASELFTFLVQSGTNPDKLKDAKAWLATRDNKETCENFLRYLESAEDLGHMPIAHGTLRKAGKWVFGDGWEPESSVLQAPADEIVKLRENIARLERQITALNGDLASTKHQNNHLQSRVKELGSQVDYLKAGRTADDLAAIGINTGRNVLESAAA